MTGAASVTYPATTHSDAVLANWRFRFFHILPGKRPHGQVWEPMVQSPWGQRQPHSVHGQNCSVVALGTTRKPPHRPLSSPAAAPTPFPGVFRGWLHGRAHPNLLIEAAPAQPLSLLAIIFLVLLYL